MPLALADCLALKLQIAPDVGKLPISNYGLLTFECDRGFPRELNFD